MSTILEHPAVQALLAETDVDPSTLRSCRQRLTRFLERYLPRFYRKEQREHASLIIQGKLTGLERKTTEPIANQAGQKRRPLQLFVGAGQWEDQAVRRELRRHVREEIGSRRAALVVDGLAVAKKGADSCGVQRQWCGHLGKVENCQVGVFLAYASPYGRALVDAALYLPQEWAADKKRRAKTYVPQAVEFKEKWRLALEQITTAGRELPHGWVVGDDEYGRVSELRSALRGLGERYVLDVPCNTLVRPLRRGADGRKPPFVRADVWAASQPKRRWRTVTLRAGEKGPLRVRALTAQVQTKEENGLAGPRERLLVLRTMEKTPRTSYSVSNASRREPLAELARVHGERHRVEELFQEGNGEVGLDQYELRAWTGWHHHMTLSMVSLWFLQLERRRIGGEKSRDHGVAGPSGDDRVAAEPAAEPARNQRPGQQSAAA